MSDRFDFVTTPLADLYRIERRPIKDSRGYFSRFFCDLDFEEIGFSGSVAQMNLTLTNDRGVVRGLHFQRPPHAETKIVTCLKGEVWDIAVDLRKGSPTFLQWHAERLHADSLASLYIPQGFAHGFQTLTTACQLLYLHTVPYAPGHQDALNVHDPRLAIEWPLDVHGLSERDQRHAMLQDRDFEGVATQ